MVKVAGGRPGGSLAGRLGVKRGGVGDARQKIIAANRDKTVDARDKLAQLAKGMGDARQKLQKIRNMKDGNLEVKKLSSGITVTKKLDGKISLSTKSRSESSEQSSSREEVQQIGRLTKTVSSSGQVSLSSRSAAKEQPRMRSASAGSRSAAPSSVLRGTTGGEKENLRKSLGSGRRELERFDEELLSFRKTVELGRGRPGQVRDRSPVRGRPVDYDDPRSMDMDTEPLRRRERDPEVDARRDLMRGEEMVSISPLQGTMVTITNLQSSVTQEDIEELFGDIGSLKKAQCSSGEAKVYFFNREDAKKAVKIYHNRQLDGKPMKCKIHPIASGGAGAVKLPPSLQKRKDQSEYQHPIEIGTIHKALFVSKKSTGKKPLFTITMPKKSKDDERW